MIWLMLAAGYMPPQNGIRGEWHKIDFTWNSNNIKLYIDGQPPKSDSTQVEFFKTAPTFPKNMAGVKLYLNDNMTWLVNPAWKTVYDEFKIYDRVLSPAETLTEYEKYYPAKATVRKPFARIPAGLPICNPLPVPGKFPKEVFATVLTFGLSRVKM